VNGGLTTTGLGPVLDNVSLPLKVWDVLAAMTIEDSARTYDLSKVAKVLPRHPNQVSAVNSILAQEHSVYGEGSGLQRAIRDTPKSFTDAAKIKVFEVAKPTSSMTTLRFIIKDVKIPSDILKDKLDKSPQIVSDFDEDLLAGPNGKELLPLVVKAVYTSSIEEKSDNWNSDKASLSKVLKREGATGLIQPYVDQLIENGLVNHLSVLSPGDLT
jgi:hypothetical protein